jgi:hypothetical protein
MFGILKYQRSLVLMYKKEREEEGTYCDFAGLLAITARGGLWVSPPHVPDFIFYPELSVVLGVISHLP